MRKDNCYLQDFGYDRFERVVEMIGGKWKLRIIYMLALHDVLRYGWIFLCGSTAVPEERIPPIQRQETAVPEQRYRT